MGGKTYLRERGVAVMGYVIKAIHVSAGHALELAEHGLHR